MNIDAAQNSANVPGWPPALIRGTADEASQTKEAASHPSSRRANPSSRQANGVSHAEEYQKTSDRDVDGRLPWQPNDKSNSKCTDDQADREQVDGDALSQDEEHGGQFDVSG
jgi:hypothetical protein